MLDKSTKKKEDRICKIAIRNAGMKEYSEYIKQTFERTYSGSIRKRKQSSLILECKELLLKHYGTCCII